MADGTFLERDDPGIRMQKEFNKYLITVWENDHICLCGDHGVVTIPCNIFDEILEWYNKQRLEDMKNLYDIGGPQG